MNKRAFASYPNPHLDVRKHRTNAIQSSLRVDDRIALRVCDDRRN
jgi:hypothetical protein